MQNALFHIYRYAEVYTVLLVWIVVPLGYWASFTFLRNHFGMFKPQPQLEKAEVKANA
jgi:hypothetical protein